MKHSFGRGRPFSVGIEEELFLVDPEGGSLVPAATGILAGIAPGLKDLVGEEIFANEVELRSPPTRSAMEAIASLVELRDAARQAGACLLGAGLHPAAGPDEARLIESERADLVRAEMRGLIARTPECALHVHVGVPDPETAVRVHDGLRSWMPLMCALAANSPYWFGRDSGLASARRAMTRPYPGRGIPDPLGDFEAYEARLAAIAAAGGPSDYTLLWWDVRLHPNLGTVEVREMDAQSRLIDVAATAALIRGLACHAAEAPDQPVSREAIEWSMFRAMRDGPEAEIFCGGESLPVTKVARIATALAAPHAKEVGDDEALAAIEDIVKAGGAARQRNAFGRDGIPGVVRLLTRETRAEPKFRRGARSA